MDVFWSPPASLPPALWLPKKGDRADVREVPCLRPSFHLLVASIRRAWVRFPWKAVRIHGGIQQKYQIRSNASTGHPDQPEFFLGWRPSMRLSVRGVGELSTLGSLLGIRDVQRLACPYWNVLPDGIQIQSGARSELLHGSLGLLLPLETHSQRDTNALGLPVSLGGTYRAWHRVDSSDCTHHPRGHWHDRVLCFDCFFNHRPSPLQSDRVAAASQFGQRTSFKVTVLQERTQKRSVNEIDAVSQSFTETVIHSSVFHLQCCRLCHLLFPPLLAVLPLRLWLFHHFQYLLPAYRRPGELSGVRASN
mmetsp:Transcript_11852/g.22751  ORF Transcript_11852/g.22751 Transcript_11852/m.22751 type:complete len:306 (+) Transcript_11852:275-1192(+)